MQYAVGIRNCEMGFHYNYKFTEIVHSTNLCIHLFTYSLMDIEKLKYPIGKFKPLSEITGSHLKETIEILQLFPEQLKLLVHNLDETAFNKTYRENSWTVRQLVHHIADSHNHAYIRFRWALTENNPSIKAYDEKAWAEMYDYKNAPIVWSLLHIEVIHHKLVNILQTMTEEQWERTYIHNITKEEKSLKTIALMYAWHSMHHYSHIKNALI